MTAADQPTTEPSVRGWIVVDKKTGDIDWDAKLHPTHEAAYLGLRAYGDTVEVTRERRTFYDVLPVLDALPVPQPAADQCSTEHAVVVRIIGAAVDGEPDDLSRATRAADEVMALLRPPARVTTEEARNALPVGHVVRSAAGSIACRVSETCGVILGDSRTFPWTLLQLPLTVLYPVPAVSAETLTAVLELRGVLEEEGVIFGCPWCPDSWESEATCEHAAAVVEHDERVRAAALRDAADVVAVVTCPDHETKQHRDGKPPWCNACGMTASGTHHTRLPSIGARPGSTRP